MAKNLLIVESPTKVKTIKKFLGKDFEVAASKGHIRDLPRKGLGVDVDSDFQPEYEISEEKKAIVKALKKLASESEVIYLAPDPDREGEAICFHLAEVLKDKKKERVIHRVMFNAITKDDVLEALEHPGDINQDLFNAQQARRILDRLVGYKISPLLWRRIKGARSAGRVQSVAVRLIVEREREIEVFVPVEYWSITANLKTGKDQSLQAELFAIDGKKLRIMEAPENGSKTEDADAAANESDAICLTTQAEADALVARLKKAIYKVQSVVKKPRSRNPYPPYITSTLQQDAARRLGFTSDRTMRIAQSLYEGVDIGSERVGLITYMRTDSTRIVDEAVTAVRGFVKSSYGEEYVPKSPRQFKSKRGAQDAHEAIRPTDVAHTPQSLRDKLSDEQLKLYELIWRRFVACQMEAARYQSTTIDIDADGCTFRATGSILQFDGFTRVYADRDEDRLVPEVKNGENLNLLDLDPQQHFTKPPPRYNEASLIRTLEERGIGRPSTYATIIKTIVDRGYVERDGRTFKPTQLGFLTNDMLVKHFPKVMDVDFTAHIEEELDEIEEGRREWHTTLREFYEPFKESLDSASDGIRQSMKEIEEETDILCESCKNHKLIKKWGKNGWFLACPGYPECKYTKSLSPEEEPEVSDEKCDKCGSAMVIKKGPTGRYLACSAYPECKSTRAVGTGVPCPKCGQGELVEKQSRRYKKVFWSCNRYPECEFASWYEPVNKPCPNCKSPYLTRRIYKREGVVIVCANKGCKYKDVIGQPEEKKAGAAEVSS